MDYVKYNQYKAAKTASMIKLTTIFTIQVATFFKIINPTTKTTSIKA